MCCSNGDAQARGIVRRQRRRPLCKTTSHNAAHSRARTSECASKLPKSAKAGAIHQMQAEQHRSTTAHMWQPSGGRLQHRRLPQGGLPVTQQPFLQPTAEAFKLLQGSIHRCAVPTLRSTAGAGSHRPQASSTPTAPPAALQTQPQATARRPRAPTSLATLQQQPAPPLHMPPLCTQQSHTASASAPAATHKGCHATQHLLTSQHLLQRRRRQPQN